MSEINQGGPGPTLVYRLNDHGQGPELVRQVFLEQGWVQFDEEEQDESDWNLWWRTSRFRTSDYEMIQPWQWLNHYPKSTAVTKKDSLARNLKRMLAVHGPHVYNFSPIAFNLPNDYTKFVAEYTKLREKHPNKTVYWICKPADLSRGRGIFIFKDLSELQYDCNAVVQQYLSNPLLISGYKFDLRIYVLVPSFSPLTVYIYKEGLVRFSTEKYDLSTLGNMYAHLTNTSINKHSPSYTTDKERVGPGCKWTLTQLRHYFHQMNIDDRIVWTKIVNIVTLTLIIQAHQVPKATNCFELYGFDIMIDDNLKPWLLEVNFSPSLGSDCQTDIIVKKPMLHDLISLLNFSQNDKERGNSRKKNSQNPKNNYGPYRSSYAQNHRSSVHKSSVARLPSISATSTASSMVSTSNSSTYTEEDDDWDHTVVPIIPGCGLPSVQHAISQNSGRSSAASSTSAKTSHGGENPQGHQSPHNRDISTPSRTVNKEGQEVEQSKSEQKEPANLGQSNKYERTTSSLSIEDMQSKLLRMTAEWRKSWPSPSSPTSSTRSQWKSLTETSWNSSPPRRDVHKPGKLLRHSRSNRLASSTENSDTGENQNLQPSTPQATTPKRKHSYPSYTANPIAKKSALLHRQINFGIYDKARVSARRSTYSQPWRRSKSGPDPVSVSSSPSKGKLENQIGEFVLVFPFNDATRRCAQASLDAKVVIRECQRLAKHCQNEVTRKKDTDRMQSQNVADTPRVWRPLKTPVEEPVS